MESEATVSPLLASGAIAAVFAVLLLMLAAEAFATTTLQRFIANHMQKGMMAVAVTATAASLYYSEVVGFIPCEFCWYQRIAMYPLAAMLVVALITRTRLAAPYLLVFAVVGLGLSTYHYQLQLAPSQVTVCTGPIPCTGRYVNEFDFVTIPFMAGCAFLSILLLQVAEWRMTILLRRRGADSVLLDDKLAAAK